MDENDRIRSSTNFTTDFTNKLVQTPEAKSRTGNIVIDNRISGPAQTDAQRANDNWDWTDVVTALSWMASAPAAVLAAQNSHDDDDDDDDDDYNDT